MNVLAFGEVIWDVYPDKSCLGGAPLNFAAHAARHGLDVEMLSAVGADELGEAALTTMREWGVGTKAVRVLNDKPTGVCRVTLDERSVPHYALCEDTAWDAIPCDLDMNDADVLYFGTLALRSDYNLSQLKALTERRAFADVFVDVNIRVPFYSKETVMFAFENATILKVSDEEWPLVCELLGVSSEEDMTVVVPALGERFPNLRVVIVTLGGEGARAYDMRAKQWHRADALSVKAVSTVGAGDSFSASFLGWYQRGYDIEACLRHAAKVAAYVVSHYEAVPPYNEDIYQCE